MSIRKIKILILLLLTLAVGIWFWFQLSLIFTSGNIGLSHLIWSVISFLVFIIFLLINFLVLEIFWLILILIVLITVSFFLFFDFNLFYLAGLVLLIIALLLSYRLIQFEKKSRLKIAFWKTWKRGLPWTLTVLILIIALVYYFNPLLKITQQEIKIEPRIIGLLLKPASGFLGGILPFYNPKMTVDEMVTMSLMTSGQVQLSQELLTPELIQGLQEIGAGELDIGQILKDPQIMKMLEKELPKQAKKIDPWLLAQQRKELSKTFGIQVKGDETFDILISKLLNEKLKDFIGPYAKEISFGIAVALFFFLRFLSIPFGWLAILLAWLLSKILVWLKVLKIEKVMKEGEEIRI